MITVAGVRVASIIGPPPALVYRSGFAIDTDGARDAYAPDGFEAADALADAGHPGDWYGLVTDTGERDGKPVRQGPNDPYPGAFIAQTALVDTRFGRTDPRRYVDAATVPYGVITRPLMGLGARAGDVGVLAVDHDGGRLCAAFVVADVGPAKKPPGEGSPALAQLVQVNADARHGGISKGATWIVFPGSCRGWPRGYSDVQTQATELLNAAGGVDALVTRLDEVVN